MIKFCHSFFVMSQKQYTDATDPFLFRRTSTNLILIRIEFESPDIHGEELMHVKTVVYTLLSQTLIQHKFYITTVLVCSSVFVFVVAVEILLITYCSPHPRPNLLSHLTTLRHFPRCYLNRSGSSAYCSPYSCPRSQSCRNFPTQFHTVTMN